MQTYFQSGGWIFFIRQMLILTPSTEFYQMWSEPEIPVYQGMYFFDIQNVEEIMKGGKPKVKEVGPYTYW